MALDTAVFNEIDNQYVIVYVLLSKDNRQLEAVYAFPLFNTSSINSRDDMEKSYNEILRSLKLLGQSPEAFAY